MKHRYTLIVSIPDYNDATHFIPLPLAQDDSQSLYEMLIDPERGGWLPEDEDGSFKLWDVYQGRELQTINHRIEIFGEVFGAKGLLANSAEDGAARVCHTEVIDS